MKRGHLGPEHRRRVGEMSVSPLGLGTVKFGRNTDVKYPSAFDLPETDELASLLALASDLGINLLDTAPAYGSSETRLGELIRGSRSDWILSTKVGEIYDGTSRWDFSAQATITSIETSLRRLKTDYLDIVLIHCPDEDVRALRDTEVVETLVHLRQAGSIRAIGASTKTVEAGLYALEILDVVMVSLQPDDQLAVISRAEALHKPVLVKKALGSGYSSDVTGDLQRALSIPAVSSVIVGTISEDHLKSNVRAALKAIGVLASGEP
ncbi:MAG: aldo/keto reductase [Proteobacteria bacterium]|jgi:aryl-alcohol dehydrogenase-like predicted oxidoreductase|nr:aldo/keto reductase [Pseudomonadota bacterium]